ncbi:cysteine proteinase inhibitor 5-like [Vicia villosa]|uniref:cysteine proteinase inhibitor 5-like n=1 Tax=Vicia villosa TaxID=3911 RepID=UPI00273CA8C0|nr:cysteine proteinase inhibitor 5-like [Vicia villosa]XP_058758680.1 cysteine proteinase inhibitor 5-like [Vicia villosa]
MRFQSPVLSILVLLAFAAMNEVISEEWRPIKEINDPYVIGVADFAVNQFNKITGANLKFEKIIKGESQIVKGKNYRFILSATDGVVSNNYQATVYDMPWGYIRNLTSFEIVHE